VVLKEWMKIDRVLKIRLDYKRRDEDCLAAELFK
jgi:hypothetical protein